MNDAPSAMRATKPSKPRVPRARILLVDDDERNLLALSEVLHGIADIVTAASGRAALRHLLNGDFAVILLDVFMPGIDGYETAQLIRERKSNSHIPIIFLSAVNKETEHLMRGYAMGAVDYVFKPVDPLILTSKVSVFVDLYKMRAQFEAKSRAEQALRDANFKAELEKLQIERELQASRMRQAAIIQSLPIILYLEPHQTEPRCPAFVSGDLEAMTGFSFDAVRADPELWQQRIHPEDRERVLTSIADRNSTGQLSIEYRWQCADGTYRHFHDQAVLLRGPAGEPIEFAGTLLDVTTQRELESQLVQAGKMDAIGQLTGGIAHDFNNLLSAVLGGILLLDRRLELGDRERQIMQQMRHAAEQGAELVRRMMAFARKQDLRPSSVDPNSLCQSVAGLVEHTLGGTVTIHWNCVETSRNLFVDRSQLELALVNLILNARDAMPDGGKVGVTIDEAPAFDAGADPFVRICVADQGHGIAPEMLGKIMEPFFTTKEAGKGTGLGLSMVLGFVQQSGGMLEVSSVPGEGSSVQILLPSTAQSAERVAPDDADQERETLSLNTVLLVDDDDAVRTVVGEQLRELGLTVRSVESGQQALELLKREGGEFDLILSDFAMPGMNGVETISQVRKLRPNIRAVLMTGYADDRDFVAERGSILTLRKPIDTLDLERKLARAA
ncbi:MAG: response regulator [Sphingomonas sp.]|uniref:response regulator n=1 Tax=Sphingomonas sp. TaxID=28214 RepID=UPI00182B0C4D|nr:response regulator [Sphingomonas sp.]MBA3666731.1 response regulator [Sphingomonas sp.]